jgi:hypothetical protein
MDDLGRLLIVSYIVSICVAITMARERLVMMDEARRRIMEVPFDLPCMVG